MDPGEDPVDNGRESECEESIESKNEPKKMRGRPKGGGRRHQKRYNTHVACVEKVLERPHVYIVWCARCGVMRGSQDKRQ